MNGYATFIALSYRNEICIFQGKCNADFLITDFFVPVYRLRYQGSSLQSVAMCNSPME